MITVTAFGPFGTVRSNPSEALARRLFADKAVVLPVSYAAVDEFLDNLPSDTEKLLMLGVAVGSKSIRIEREASDGVGTVCDNDGNCLNREETTRLRGSLFEGIEQCACWIDSFDAGSFLCNYIYYEALRRRPDLASGFVHVPPFTSVPFPIQAVRLSRLYRLITS